MDQELEEVPAVLNQELEEVPAVLNQELEEVPAVLNQELEEVPAVLNQELEEVPAVLNNHNPTESTRQDILTEHEFSSIPMYNLAKKPIDWSQASQQQANLSSSPEYLPTIELDSIQGNDVVV